ncbi:MAG: 30S ribosomal protein S12 methylthiotransferase RimO [Armatimonadota bacterium]
MAIVGLISLGCPKNVVDAEEILGELANAGHEITDDPERAEVLVVNTCGFIRSAKEESIEAVLDAVRRKTSGACRSVIVTGCLSQRYGDELAREIPEADGVIGVGAAGEIAEAVERTLSGERLVRVGEPSHWWLSQRDRVLSTQPWTAYLRVADGCDNRCTYCAIPSIRGGFASRPEADVLAEAKALADSGVKELNLVAQDVTRYGLDTGETSLAKLLYKLGEIEGLRWIRLLYCYPTRIGEELIRAVTEVDKVCKYIDIPLQHCSRSVLSAMGRPGGRDDYLRLFARIRESCPEAALRTTFIVGFPGETEEDFEELLSFVEEVRFDRVGAFVYSPEEGTPAASLPQSVRPNVAASRQRRLMDIAGRVSLENNRRLVGKKMQVLVEESGRGSAVGRSYRDAPEIDGSVLVEGDAPCGEIIAAEIIAAGQYDLTAKPV